MCAWACVGGRFRTIEARLHMCIAPHMPKICLSSLLTSMPPHTSDDFGWASSFTCSTRTTWCYSWPSRVHKWNHTCVLYSQKLHKFIRTTSCIDLREEALYLQSWKTFAKSTSGKSHLSSHFLGHFSTSGGHFWSERQKMLRNWPIFGLLVTLIKARFSPPRSVQDLSSADLLNNLILNIDVAKNRSLFHSKFPCQMTDSLQKPRVFVDLVSKTHIYKSETQLKISQLHPHPLDVVSCRPPWRDFACLQARRRPRCCGTRMICCRCAPLLWREHDPHPLPRREHDPGRAKGCNLSSPTSLHLVQIPMYREKQSVIFSQSRF